MTAHRMILLPLVWLGLLFLSGCANENDMVPQTGAVARSNDRFDLVEGGVYEGHLNTNNLTLIYSIAEAGNNYKLLGSLSINDDLTESFPVVQEFTLTMSFLDNAGRVLKTIDISPSIDFDGVPAQMPITASGSKPAGASAIAFHYFGRLRGRADTGGGDTRDIYYFPYE